MERVKYALFYSFLYAMFSVCTICKQIKYLIPVCSKLFQFSIFLDYQQVCLLILNLIAYPKVTLLFPRYNTNTDDDYDEIEIVQKDLFCLTF